MASRPKNNKGPDSPLVASSSVVKKGENPNESAQKKVDDAVKNNERMDEVVEREGQADRNLRALLVRVFPNDCRREGEDQNIPQDQIIDLFLEKNPDLRWFFVKKGLGQAPSPNEPQQHLGDMAKEIRKFFWGNDFMGLLNFTGSKKEKERKRIQEGKRIEKYLQEECGLKNWKNQTEEKKARKATEEGVRKTIDDLEEFHHRDIVPAVSAEKLWDEDRIQDGFGVIAEPTPEIPVADETNSHSRAVKNVEVKPKNREDRKEGKIGKTESIQGDFEYQASLGDVPEMKMKLHDEVEAKENLEESELPLQGDVPDLERFKLADSDDENKTLQSGMEKRKNVQEEMRGEGGETTSEETMEALRGRVLQLKKESDEARDRYFLLKHRNESKWLSVKRYFASFRSATLPQPLVDELEVLKSDWNYKLTLYKDARVSLAKREAVAESGHTAGEAMAEALLDLEFRNSIETWDAWRTASIKDRGGDSWYEKTERSAKAVGEWYRNLPWQAKIAITGGVFGLGAAGALFGSGAVVGSAVVLDILRRALGGYVAKEGLFQGLEAWNRKQSAGYHEAAAESVRNAQDIGFLENNKRLRNYADIKQKDFERMVKEQRTRSRKSIVAGCLLFGAGTAFAYRDAIAEVSGKVSNGFSKLLEQMKIISGFEDFRSAPVSIAETPASQAMGTAAERVADIPVGSGSTTEEMLRAAKQPISGAVEVASPVSGTGGLASEVMGAGVVDHGTAAEVAKKISETLIDTVAVPKGSNVWETVRQYVMEHGGISDRGEAEKITARIVNNFVNTSREGISLFDLSHVQPDTRLGLILNPDPESAIKLPFKLDSVEFAPVSGANTVAEIAPVVPVIEPTPVELTPLEPVNIPSMQSASELTPTESVSPPDIFEKATELTPLEPVHISEVQPAVQLESVEPTPLSEIETAPLSSEPSDAFEKYKPLAYAGLAGVGAAAVAETVRQRRRENSYKKEKEAKLQQEVREKKFMEILAQVDSLVSFPKDRWNALWEMRETYGAYSEERATDDVFEGTRKKITKVLFGSEDVPEDVLDNMFLAVAQQGLGNPENKSLEEIRTGIKNGYSVFQVIFGRTGERLPAGKISGLSVREVLRLFTERFLSGNIPEELLDSQG